MITKQDAIDTLRACGLNGEEDFYVLSSSTVLDLLTFADKFRYRAPKNANGSRGRYFYAYLQRLARRESGKTEYINATDGVFRLSDGFYCLVNGRTFGAWDTKEYALAGMATEQRRLAAKG